MKTPGGRHLGRRQDTHDPRDYRFISAHAEAAAVALPPSVDLRHPGQHGMVGLPPCFDQGKLGSCGPNAADALMCWLFPDMAGQGFSRLQIYRDVRELEGTIYEDAGVQTRDLFKVLATTGAAPEPMWPYEPGRFLEKPPQHVYDEAQTYKISSYSRLVSGSNYLQCLASGMPFVLGFDVPESLDSDETNRTGIMTVPGGKSLGGHDVLAVGYVLNFKSDSLFKKSGVDPALVSDEMLIIRNSWGAGWSRLFRGHFFMPLQFALDNITGNDAWTAKR